MYKIATAQRFTMVGTDGTVLVAGDRVLDLEPVTSERLRDYEVVTVTSREHALDYLERAAAVDCVVTDGADEERLERFLRRLEGRVPTVVVTNGTHSPAVALDAGATEVVTETGSALPIVLARRIENAIAAETRVEPTARDVVGSLVDGNELVALFDADGSHLLAVGSRLAEGLEPGALESTAVGEAFADRPSIAAHLDANYVAAIDGERRERELAFGDGTYHFETIPVDGAPVGLLRVRPATAVSGPPIENKEARRKLHRLHDIASELEAAESEAEIFELAIDCAERILEFDASNIGEVEDGYIVARAATAPELDVDVSMVDSETGVAGRTISTGESFLVEDVAANDEATPTDDAYRSALSVPLGESGVFQAISTEEGYYGEEDLALAELLVAHVANALDRVRFQEALTVERDHFAALFQNVPDAAVEYVLDDDADAPRIESVNSAFVRLFGYEPDDAIGHSTLELLVPDDEREAARALYADIADGERVDSDVIRTTTDGVAPFLLRSVPVAAEEGRQGYLIYTDLSELKERERELQQKNQRLDRFASVVSHDLRNPLSVAAGYLEQTQETGDLSLLEEVERGHDRTFAIIDDVLTLAREGETVTEPEPVDLDVVAGEAWENVDTRGATLSVDSAGEVSADRSRLRQLLENLFRNAVEHGPAEGAEARALTVTVADTDDGFVVTDDGVGFPDGVDTDRLFEYGHSTSAEGTGFGLSIVADVADGHGWAVDARASDDGGAAFRFESVDRPDA